MTLRVKVNVHHSVAPNGQINEAKRTNSCTLTVAEPH